MRIDIWGERWLLMGRPKVGKSTLAASFPKPLVINGDGPQNKYVYPHERMINVYSYSDYIEALIEAQRRDDWLSLVLDSIDKFVINLDREVSDRFKVQCVGDVSHGKGYSKQKALFAQFLEDFWSVAEERRDVAASIIIAHSMKGEAGETLTIREKLHAPLQGGVNNILYCHKIKDERRNLKFMADCSGDAETQAGCRNKVLQGAGVIEASFSNILELFAPSKDQLDKAFTWLETKGGISKETFIEACKRTGHTTSIQQYEFIRELRREGSQGALELFKKRTESE